jgi:hypothetical protein
MDSLAAAAADEEQLDTVGAGGESRPPLSQSSSAARLIAPQLLHTRQTSTESTNSHASRFQPDSALHALAEQVASAKQTSDEKVNIDMLLLGNVLTETEDLRDQIAGLKSKYSGAKASLVAICEEVS